MHQNFLIGIINCEFLLYKVLINPQSGLITSDLGYLIFVYFISLVTSMLLTVPAIKLSISMITRKATKFITILSTFTSSISAMILATSVASPPISFIHPTRKGTRGTFYPCHPSGLFFTKLII